MADTQTFGSIGDQLADLWRSHRGGARGFSIENIKGTNDFYNEDGSDYELQRADVVAFLEELGVERCISCGETLTAEFCVTCEDGEGE